MRVGISSVFTLLNNTTALHYIIMVLRSTLNYKFLLFQNIFFFILAIDVIGMHLKRSIIN